MPTPSTANPRRIIWSSLSFKVKKPQHNLVRTRCQIALAKDMLNKMDAMNAIVQDCARRYKETENA